MIIYDTGVSGSLEYATPCYRCTQCDARSVQSAEKVRHRLLCPMLTGEALQRRVDEIEAIWQGVKPMALILLGLTQAETAEYKQIEKTSLGEMTQEQYARFFELQNKVIEALVALTKEDP